MSVTLSEGLVRLEGACRIEEAETLLQLLLEDRARAVDLGGARELHTAVVQVLMALQPPCRAWPEERFLRELVAPALGLGPAVSAKGANL